MEAAGFIKLVLWVVFQAGPKVTDKKLKEETHNNEVHLSLHFFWAFSKQRFQRKWKQWLKWLFLFWRKNIYQLLSNDGLDMVSRLLGWS